ncbi:MAG: hypothetical protein P1P86_15795 [Bacteroidales bacterium]|nr:hypothetical protein [Bacteroidales bacterium]
MKLTYKDTLEIINIEMIRDYCLAKPGVSEGFLIDNSYELVVQGLKKKDRDALGLIQTGNG